MEEVEFSWKEISRSVDSCDPGERFRHTCVSIPNENKILLIGGRNTDSGSSNLLIYDLETNSWKEKYAPKGLRFHTTNLISLPNRNFVVCYGGWGNSWQPSLDVIEIDLPSLTWTSVDGVSTVKNIQRDGIAGHTSVTAVNGEDILIFGGSRKQRGNSNDLWIYRVIKREFELIETRGNKKPRERMFHSAVLVEKHNSMLVMGGVGQMSSHRDPISSRMYSNDLWEYSIERNEWKEISLSAIDSIPGRGSHRMIPILDCDNRQSCILLAPGLADEKKEWDSSSRKNIYSFWKIDLDYNKEINCKRVEFSSNNDDNNDDDIDSKEIDSKNSVIWGYEMIQHRDKVLLTGGIFRIFPEAVSCLAGLSQSKRNSVAVLSITRGYFNADIDLPERVEFLRSYCCSDEEEIKDFVEISVNGLAENWKLKKLFYLL